MYFNYFVTLKEIEMNKVFCLAKCDKNRGLIGELARGGGIFV